MLFICPEHPIITFPGLTLSHPQCGVCGREEVLGQEGTDGCRTPIEKPEMGLTREEPQESWGKTSQRQQQFFLSPNY